MPTYMTPGVYVEEIERGPRPIEGVPTSTAAFLGETERGPLRPRLVTSYNEYKRWFGDVFADGRYMPHAVSGFFENGGKLNYICRITGANATPASREVGDYIVTASGPGSWGKRVWIKIEESSTKAKGGGAIGFRLKVAYWSVKPEPAFDPFDPEKSAELPRPQLLEDYDDLTVDPLSSNYFGKRLVDSNTNQPVSALIRFEPKDPAVLTVPAATGGDFLDRDGADDDAKVVDFKGVRTEPIGLAALDLDPFRSVSLVYAPFAGAENTEIAIAIIEHCERSRFRFAVADEALKADPRSLSPRDKMKDSTYGALYAPWLWTSDPLTGARVQVPPSGHVLGVYARTDTERGVFKAPANEVVRGALDVTVDINDSAQEVMNPAGVNAIRRLPGRGIRVWGARTMSSNALWKYVSVRRLFIFLERSIYEGTQWVVFEPNDDKLWARVKDTLRLFLRAQWRSGALFGRTEEEAFFITCDRTTMTQHEILNGILVCEVGIAPVRPAEFVVFRVFQHTAESQR